MSKPEPIYETGWMECQYGYYRDGDYFLCDDKIREVFLLDGTDKIKIGIFTSPCREAVKIKRNPKPSHGDLFYCDGKPTVFASEVDTLLINLMGSHDAKTLYAKCYGEA